MEASTIKEFLDFNNLVKGLQVHWVVLPWYAVQEPHASTRVDSS